MGGLSPVTVDLERAEIVLAGRRIPLTADPDSTAAADVAAPATRFRVVDDGDGTAATVRLLTFGERSRLVRLALADAAPARALMNSLRQAALDGPERLVFDAVLLALAGGAEQAPDFDGCAVDAARARAWNWRVLHDTPAILVDRAVPRADAYDEAGGWKRFVFPGADPRELEALLESMVATLLARGSGGEEPASSQSDAEPEPHRPARRSAAARHVPAEPPEAATVSPTQSAAPGPPPGLRWRALAPVGGSASSPASVDVPAQARARGGARPPAMPGRELRPAVRASVAASSATRTAASPLPAARVAAARPRPASIRSTDLPGSPNGVPPLSGSVQAAAARQPAAMRLDLADAPAPATWPSAPEVPAAAGEWRAPARHPRSGAVWAGSARAADTAAMPSRGLATTADIIEQVATALAAECDLRGLDT